MAIVITRKLDRRYGHGAHAVQALRGVDIVIETGEFTALMGPTGSGKTTLLELIGGLEAPSGGSVQLDGQNIGSMDGTKRFAFGIERLGFVFQAYNLIPVLTAYHNTQLVLELQGVPRAERRERVLRALQDVGLEGMEQCLPADLDAGQQQRLALARAIVGEPALVLADEPTTNLNADTGCALLDTMRELNERLGITFLFATQDPKVMKRARRVVKLVDGRVDEDLRK